MVVDDLVEETELYRMAFFGFYEAVHAGEICRTGFLHTAHATGFSAAGLRRMF
jgi:hypothetical protein